MAIFNCYFHYKQKWRLKIAISVVIIIDLPYRKLTVIVINSLRPYRKSMVIVIVKL